jgi:hypothetical protein
MTAAIKVTYSRVYYESGLCRGHYSIWVSGKLARIEATQHPVIRFLVVNGVPPHEANRMLEAAKDENERHEQEAKTSQL